MNLKSLRGHDTIPLKLFFSGLDKSPHFLLYFTLLPGGAPSPVILQRQSENLSVVPVWYTFFLLNYIFVAH